MSHIFRGMCESSKIVPLVTVNCLRHPPHFQTPTRTGDFESGLAFRRYASPTNPQKGQTVPSGQRCFSKNSRAASTSAYCFAIELRFMLPSILYLGRILRKMLTHTAHYAYGYLYCKLLPQRKSSWQSLRHRQCLSPWTLLREFRQDLHNCLSHMAERIETLPQSRICQSQMLMDLDLLEIPHGHMPSPVCIQSTRSFARSRPLATVFEWEAFAEGWVEGYQCAPSIHDK